MFEKAQSRFQWVDVAGFGKVGIRSVSRLVQSMRDASMRDLSTGMLIQEELAKSDVFSLIDQLMVDEDTPMFDESDADLLCELDAAKIAPLLFAIAEFNGGDPDAGK